MSLNIVPQRSPEPMMTSAAVNWLAHQIGGGLADALGQHVHHGVEVSEPERGTRRRFLARESSLADRRFQAARPEEHPFQIDAALWIADRDVELGLREFVGEIGADRGGLSDDRIAMLERGQLAHRIDGEKFRLPVLALLEADEFHLVGLAKFLEHPVDDRGAGGGGMVKSDARHLGTSVVANEP